jgi:acyl-CoA dehydrogenase
LQKNPDARYYQHINRLSAGFAFLADTSLLVLGNSLMRKERTSARLGDIFSNLYLASQVLRRFELEGRQAEDVPLMQWAAEHCLHEAESAMVDLIENHPSRLVRSFMKPIVLPLGSLLKKPSDRLEAKVAELVSKPGPARDRLTAGIYMPSDENDYLNRLERTLTLTTEAGKLEELLYKAAKQGRIARSKKFEDMVRQAVDLCLISDNDAAVLAEVRAATEDIVKVNHFPREWVGKPQSPA